MTEIPPLGAMAPATRVLFFDIEASGLHAASVPVELGWAWITREVGDGPALRVKTEAMLIRPLRAWMEDPKTWDSEAKRIHGITRRELVEAGRPAGEVVLALDQARTGKSIVSDTGRDGVDARWLRKLHQAARKPRYPGIARVDLSHFWWSFLQETKLKPEASQAVRELAPQPSHRAAEDAAKPAWILATLATLADMASNDGEPPRSLPSVARRGTSRTCSATAFRRRRTTETTVRCRASRGGAAMSGIFNDADTVTLNTPDGAAVATRTRARSRHNRFATAGLGFEPMRARMRGQVQVAAGVRLQLGQATLCGRGGSLLFRVRI